MAKIILKRSKSWADKMRAYQIILDGKNVGEINEGKVCTFECPSGPHRLKLKVDWCGSPELEFNLDSDSDIITFECRNDTGPLLILGYAFLPHLWNKWITLVQSR